MPSVRNDDNDDDRPRGASGAHLRYIRLMRVKARMDSTGALLWFLAIAGATVATWVELRIDPPSEVAPSATGTSEVAPSATAPTAARPESAVVDVEVVE